MLASSFRKSCRGVAQPGRAPGSGPGGRRFKSSLPDHSKSSEKQIKSRRLNRCYFLFKRVPVSLFAIDEDSLLHGKLNPIAELATHNNSYVACHCSTWNHNDDVKLHSRN